MLYLPSNLVSSLGLPVWLKLHKLLITRLPSKKTNRNSTCPHTAPECALLGIRLCRPHNMEFVLQGVFLIACNECFLAPDTNFDPENPYNMYFKDAKLSCHLTSPISPADLPFAVSDFPKCISNLHSIEKIVKLERRVEILSAVGDHLGKMQFKIQHSLF